MESRDSGLWINSFDYTGIQHISPLVPEINDSFRTHCREDRPFCGYPWFLPVKFLSKSVAPLSFSDALLCRDSSTSLLFQEELVPACSRGDSQLSGGVQPAVPRGDQLGDHQNDLQGDRLGALALRILGSESHLERLHSDLDPCAEDSSRDIYWNVLSRSYQDSCLGRNVEVPVPALNQ